MQLLTWFACPEEQSRGRGRRSRAAGPPCCTGTPRGPRSRTRRRRHSHERLFLASLPP